jgi:NADPH-dependent glutamate synthase beta subunit-like oxidoreductase
MPGWGLSPSEDPLTITRHDIDLQFKFDVASLPGAAQVKKCFECGTCAGVCPVSESEIGFDPRKILHMVKFGLKDRLLSSQILWHCTHCDTCAFVCPQDISFSSVVDVLREMAFNQGYIDGSGIEQWGTAPCKAACPAHISIPGFVGAIAEGRYDEGLKLIKQEMPFPAICGRICPHPCEAKCNRGKIDEPIAIETLKRFLADEDISRDMRFIPRRKRSRPQKVAVIGAGPAGLTAAYYLAIEGYSVTVFEKHPVAGGMMAVGIPDFRLPKDILRAEVNTVEALGVEIRLNVEIGKDLTFKELQDGYEAVFVGIGCHRAMRLGIPGEAGMAQVIDGLTFLRELNLGNPPSDRGRLVVIGGGNTAVDCARAARRLGFGDVAILYRRTRNEMPASSWEVDDTIEEGVDIQFLTAPSKIMRENGKLTGVECIRMKMGEPDDSGRRRPVPIESSAFVIPIDFLVTAIGQQPDLNCFSHELETDISKNGLIAIDPVTGGTHISGVFSGGDVVSGPRTVVEAVASGKKAAMNIDRYLRGENLGGWRNRDWKGIDFLPDDAGLKEREQMQRIPLAKRTRTFEEIDLGFDPEKAKREADRCLRRCGMQDAEAVHETHSLRSEI